MTNPRNTTEEMKDTGNVLGFLAQSVADGNPSRAIENMEAQGQRELVNSTVIPTKGTGTDEYEWIYPDNGGQSYKDPKSNREKYEELGFVFGEPVPGDDLFINVQLPEGWTRKGSSHAMWSYIHDERDIPRVNVFYKAAFYDRGAHCGFNSVPGAYVSAIKYGNTEPGDDHTDVREKWWPVMTDEEKAKTVAALARAIADFRVYDEAEDLPRKAKLEEELEFTQASWNASA